jgi:putative transposase
MSPPLGFEFGTIIARKLRRGRPRPDGRWHLDEVFVSINSRQRYTSGVPWTAKARSWTSWFNHGETTKAALKLMRKLLKKQGIAPSRRRDR